MNRKPLLPLSLAVVVAFLLYGGDGIANATESCEPKCKTFKDCQLDCLDGSELKKDEAHLIVWCEKDGEKHGWWMRWREAGVQELQDAWRGLAVGSDRTGCIAGHFLGTASLTGHTSPLQKSCWESIEMAYRAVGGGAVLKRNRGHVARRCGIE
jgi:hypothetical protein